MRRFAVGGAIVAAVVGSASPAFAYDCFNASKPVDKGNSVTIDPDTNYPVDPNPGADNRVVRAAGNVGLDFTGDGIADASVMLPGIGLLPEPAIDNCDGHGIDSYEACEPAP